MKLRHFLPISVLAVLALAACGETADSSSSDSTPGPEVSALKDIIAAAPEGLLGDDALQSVFDNIEDGKIGVSSSVITGQVGATPAILTDGSQATMEYYAGTGAIDGDKVQVSLETELSVAESNGSGGYVLGEALPNVKEVTTVWKDGANVNLANVSNDDYADAYSFLATSSAEDVDISLFKDYVNSGDLLYYAALAEEAYTYFNGGDSFAEVSLHAYAEKIVDSESSEVYLHIVYYTLGSWFGLYSAEAVGNPAGPGKYIDRGEVYGFEAYVNADGIFDTVYTYSDHFINWTYEDLNHVEGDPVPSDPLTQEEIDALDLVLVSEGWGFVYGVMMHQFDTDAASVTLPDVAQLRAADASDSTYLFTDLAAYGFTL